MQLPRRLCQRDRPSRQQDSSPRLAKEEEVGEERDEAEDCLDPEHPPVVELLADPSVHARSDGLTGEDPERVDGHAEPALVRKEKIGDRASDERVADRGGRSLLWGHNTTGSQGRIPFERVEGARTKARAATIPAMVGDNACGMNKAALKKDVTS